MKRSYFLQSLGLGATGLILPKSLLTKSMIKIYDNYIRGMTHYDYKKVKNQISVGDKLQLVREKENMHDAFAVQVFYNNHKLGYLAAYENIVIANMLDAKVELKSYVSECDDNRGYFKSMSVEIFTELITPTPQLISELQNKRADEVTDIYRKGYKI